jgi:hypothetical protein
LNVERPKVENHFYSFSSHTPSESSNIGLVVKKIIYWQTTKPILLDSLRTAAVMCSKSSNIGLVDLKKNLPANDQANIA